jgi:hypothetical protein
VAETAITVEPVIPQTPEQQAVSRSPEPFIVGPPPLSQMPATWTLYEVMPVDGHSWFAGMTDEQIRALIPMQMTGLAQPQYEKFIAPFLRDGKPADEVNDPPDNIWYEVKFKQPYSVLIDAAAVASIDSDPFDSEGRAVLDRLRSADPGAEAAKSEFEVGQTGIFDKATTDDLVGRGIADKVRPIYRRRLNDFELRYHAVNSLIVELNGRIRALTLDVASIQASKAKADSQATLLEDYRTKLNDDLAKVRFELDEMTKYAGAVATRLGEVRAELSQLYRSNKALSRELAALNAQLTDEIERRTRSATASAN